MSKKYLFLFLAFFVFSFLFLGFDKAWSADCFGLSESDCLNTSGCGLGAEGMCFKCSDFSNKFSCQGVQNCVWNNQCLGAGETVPSPTVISGACENLGCPSPCDQRSDCMVEKAWLICKCVSKSSGGATGISSDADFSGVSASASGNNLVVSGNFKGGIESNCSSGGGGGGGGGGTEPPEQRSWNNVFSKLASLFDWGSKNKKQIAQTYCQNCRPFKIVGVYYSIDGSSFKNLSCFSQTSAGNCSSGGGGGGGGGGSTPKPPASAFINSVSAASSCPGCSYYQYAFSGCGIDIGSLSSGSHSLKLNFKTDSTIKNSYEKTIYFSKTGSVGVCDPNESRPNGSNPKCPNWPEVCCYRNSCSVCRPGGEVIPTPQPQKSAVQITVRMNNQARGGMDNVKFSLSGSSNYSDFAPKVYSNLNPGNYLLTYVSGAPSGSSFKGITIMKPTDSVNNSNNNQIGQFFSGNSASFSVVAGETVQLFLDFSSATITPDQSISVSHLVKNITKGTGWTNQVAAAPGDRLAFSVNVSASGNTEAKSVVVSENISGKIIFQPQSLSISNNKNLAGDLFGRGLEIGDLKANESRSVYFEATVATKSQFAFNAVDYLDNVANVFAVGIANRTAKASVVVGNGKPTSALSLTASVRNSTIDGFAGDYAEIKVGETAEFRLVVLATGEGSAQKVNLGFSLPSALQYVYGTGKIDGSLTDKIEEGNLYFGDLNPGSSRIVTFSAKASSDYQYDLGENILDFSYQASGANIKNHSSGNLQIKVIKEAESKMNVYAGVRLAGAGQDFYSRSVSVWPGEKVVLGLKIGSKGDIGLNGVSVKVALPKGLSFVSGSAETEEGDLLSDSIVSSGVNLGNISVNENRVLFLTANVLSSAKGNLIPNFIVSAANQNAVTRTAEVSVFSESGSQVKINNEILAYNETKNQDATIVAADPGDIIRFILNVKNGSSSAEENYNIKFDLLGLEAADVLAPNNSLITTNNQLVWNSVYVSPNSVISKEFKVRIKPAKDWGLSRKLSAVFGNNLVVDLTFPKEINEPKLEIAKTVNNLTWPNGTLSSVDARPNDQLEFVVEVKNTAPVMIGEVKVVENLPPKLNFVEGNETASYNSLTGEIIWNIGSLLPGETRRLRLLASVASDAFIPTIFGLTAHAEASTGLRQVNLASNEVKANIKSFVPVDSGLWKIVVIVLGVLAIITGGYLTYRHFGKKKDEYIPLGEN